MFICKIPLTRKDIHRIEKQMKNSTASLQNDFVSFGQSETKQQTVSKFHFEWTHPQNELEYVCCWNCSYKIPYKESVGIPVDIVDQSFRCYGYFCSWSCAARYLYDKYFIINPQDYYNQYSLLCIAYQRIHNCTKCILNKAPPKEVLKEFGGTVDYNDYRSKDHNVDFYKLPLVPLDIYIMNMTKTK